MKAKAWGKLLLVLLLMVPLTGCYDRTELEEQAFVVVIGLDKGEGSNIKVTYQIANPQVGSTDKASAPNEPASEIVTFTAPDFLTARDLANTAVTRKVTFSHAKTMIVSEELARSDEFYHVISSTSRDRQIRRGMDIVVSREKASEFIRNNVSPLETRPHKLFDFMSGRWQDTAMVPLSDINRFFQCTESNSSLFLSIYTTAEERKHKPDGLEDNYLPGEVDMRGGDKSQFIGSAVFKSGKMIGTLSGEETRGALLLRPEEKASTMQVTFPDPLKPKFRVSIILYKQKATSVKANVDGPAPTIEAKVPVLAEILAIPSFVDYVDNVKNQQVLKQAIKTQMETKLGKLVKRTQKEFEAEPFQWSLPVRKKFWTLQEFKSYDWMKKYPSAKVNIEVELTLRKFGKQQRPPLVHERR